MRHANDLCPQFNITKGQIELKCNGLGAVKTVSNLYSTINPSHPHFDLLSSISSALSYSPLTWRFNHVKGHRDGKVCKSDLSNWEFWNVIADREAKSILMAIRRQPNWQSY